MYKLLLYIFDRKEYQRRERIRSSVRSHYQENGYTRKVPIKEMGRVVSYIYLPIRQSHKGCKWV